MTTTSIMFQTISDAEREKRLYEVYKRLLVLGQRNEKVSLNTNATESTDSTRGTDISSVTPKE